MNRDKQEFKQRVKSYFQSSLPKRKQTTRLEDIKRNAFLLDDELTNMGINKKYYIKTFGCQMNVHDSEVISGILEMMNYSCADNVFDADVILINTCAVRENAENKVFGELGNIKHLKQENPQLLLGICGCMSQEKNIVEKILKTYSYVDLVFGTHNIYRLPQLIKEAYFNKETTVEVFYNNDKVIENLPKNRESNIKAWVNIAYGCDKYCTYCIIPYTRGKERSRLKEDIILEIKELKDLGYKEVTLLGQNVNSYGRDLNLGYDFGDLLETVAKTGIERIRFVTSHPWNFNHKMINIINYYDNIMPHIHLPVQSGSDNIVRRMRRNYTIEEYKNLYDSLRKLKKEIAITTDIIVGFPNETDYDFKQTIELVDYCKFDGAYTFIYSPREGTPAAKMKDNISIEVKKERLQELNKHINRHALEKNTFFKNRILKVLVHGVSKKNPNILSGYTEQNKLVNFKGNTNHIGKIVSVLIEDIKTWSLYGKIINK